MHVVLPSGPGCFADLIMEGSSHGVPANLGCTSTKLRLTRTTVIPALLLPIQASMPILHD